MNLLIFLCLFSFSALYIIFDNRKSVNNIVLNNGKIIIKPNENMLFFTIICGCLTALCASRSLTDSYDTGVYIAWLNRIQANPILKFDGEFRPGFEYLSKIVIKLVAGNYRAYFAVLVILNCIIVFKAISNINEFSGVSFVLYIGLIGLNYNYIVIRSGIAISFIMLSLSYINKSHRKMIFFFVIAVLFHETALVVLLSYILLKYVYPINKYKEYILLFISIILYYTKIFDRLIYQFMNLIYPHLPASWFHRYILYMDTSDADYSISLYYIICFVLTAIIIYFLPKENNIYNKLLFINIMGQLLFSIYSSNTIMGRIWNYTVSTTFVFLLPQVFRNRINSLVLNFLVFLMGLGLHTEIIILRFPFY